MNAKKIFHPSIVVTLLLLSAFTVPFITTDLDLVIQKWFYNEGWLYGHLQPWAALYRYGSLPGLILAIIAVFILVGSLIWPKIASKRRAAALIILTLIIGPGLLVNVLGKGYWGRPRPREVVQFDGHNAFQRIHQPGTAGRGKSFPCGHASIGFFLVVMAFADSKRKWLWFGTGMTYGTLMGIARMAQGAHFASDVIWAGGLTFLSASILHHAILPAFSQKESVPYMQKSRKLLGTTIMIISLTSLIVFFLIATPYYKVWEKKYMAPPDITHVQINLDHLHDPIHIYHADQAEALTIRSEMLGFGYPKLNLDGQADVELNGNSLSASAKFKLKGFVTERSGKIIFVVKKGLFLSLDTDAITQPVFLGDNKTSSALGNIRLIARKTPITLNMAESSVISGHLTIITEDKPLNINIKNIHDPGKEIWKIGTTKGKIDFSIEQDTRPVKPIRLSSWSRYNILYFNATIGTYCGLNMRWDEKNGQSMVFAKGTWQQEPNFIYGPTGMSSAHMETLLATESGTLNLKVNQGQGEALTAIPSPVPATPKKTAIFDMDDHTSHAASFPAMKVKELVKPAIPAWVQEELIALPYENPEASWGIPPQKTASPVVE